MLLERGKELSRAKQALGAAGAGDGSMLAVIGPPGVGKSALLRSVADACAPHARVLRAGGTVVEQDFAFGIAQQLFEPLMAGVPESRWAACLGSGAGMVREMLSGGSWSTGSYRSLGQEAILHALQSLIVDLSGDEVLLIMVDDLQWADAPSLRWLAYLAKRLGNARVLIAGAFTEDCAASDHMLLREIAASAARTLYPMPLSAGAVRQVVGEEFGQPCDPAFARACHEVSGGNPALLYAMLRELRTAGFTPVASRAADVHAVSQPFLRDRRMFCLSIQPAMVRDLVQAMVVLGDLAEPELISELAGLDSIDYKSAMQTLDRLGLLAGGDAPRFVHQSLRHGIESAMSVRTRTQMHRRAAALLHAAGHPAEQVADQLLLVTSGYEPWEFDTLRAAAGTALERGSAREAVRYLRHALLHSPPDSEDRGRRLADLAAAERSFDLASSVTHLAQAMPMLTSATERASAALSIPPALAAVNPSLGALVRDAASRLHDLDPACARDDLGLRLEARDRYLNLQDGTRLGEAADRLRRFGADVPVSTGAGRELLTVLTYAAAVTGAVTAGGVCALATRILERELPHAGHAYTALPLLVPALILADATAPVAQWLDALPERALDGVAVLVNAERAAILRASGRPAQAKSLALSVLDNADPAWPEAAAMAVWTLAMVALDTRDAELAERVIRTGPESGDLRVLVAHRMMRGMLDAVRGDLPAALDRFLDSGKQLARCGWTNTALYPWRVWAAAVSHRLGRTQVAAELAVQELAFAREWCAPAVYGRALRLHGTLTPGEEGVDLLRRAVDTLRGSEDRIELSRTLMFLAGRLGGGPSTGPSAGLGGGLGGGPGGGLGVEEFGAEGRRVAQECGVSWAEGSWAGDSWGGAGEDAGVNGPALRLVTPERGELTRTEETVAAFVLRGWTNQQIADSLGVTRRAVEKSLTSTYRKLGVSGRAALVEELGTRNTGE
ncbi:LuxR family transcriptional regulator [Nonomuraea sp. NPDC050404]|uniref:helix-turn-helix transcriptional regulator n=1 Tax=Nonomuraea sp. NPDC050404 TaxID=3155783 RepID=UPI0033D49166